MRKWALTVRSHEQKYSREQLMSSVVLESGKVKKVMLIGFLSVLRLFDFISREFDLIYGLLHPTTIALLVLLFDVSEQ